MWYFVCAFCAFGPFSGLLVWHRPQRLLVASGVALHFRVDNASYRMISKHGGGGIMATIYQEVPFCFSSTIHLCFHGWFVSFVQDA
jgi:hypothetical protein